MWEKYKLQDTVPYTPWKIDQDVIVFPGAIGGGNWNGVAFNKKHALIITNVMNAGQWGHLETRSCRATIGGERPPGRRAASGADVAAGTGGRTWSAATARRPFRKVTPEGGRFWEPKSRYSCNRPPWGELIAVNANTGDIAWRVPLGVFEELEKKGIKTGTPSLGGGITTGRRSRLHRARPSTATSAPSMRATARSCGRRSSTVPAHSIPSTYMGRDGKQYVVITGRRRRIPAQPAR